MKLIKALDTIINEASFRITPEEILIEFMDPSRICLTRINLRDTSYKFHKNIEVSLNIGDLKDVLKCEANDKSRTTLQFGEETLFLGIKINFTRLHGVYKDPYETVVFLEKLGKGNSSYELVEILSPEETAKMKPTKRVFEGEPSFF